MKQQISTPVAVLIIVVALAIIGIVGWRLINPPEPKPVSRPAGEQMMPPMIPPAATGQQGQSGQPQQGTQPVDPM
jgi:hypothetical protein